MKLLLNIILLLLITTACSGQSKKSLLYYDRAEVDTILMLKNFQIEYLANENTKLQLFIDSLLTTENLEAPHPSSSFITILDTAYVFIADSMGNSVEVRKNGSQINVITSKETARISSFFGDQRRVFFMDSTNTSAAMVEDSLNFLVNLPDLGLKITGDK